MWYEVVATYWRTRSQVQLGGTKAIGVFEYECVWPLRPSCRVRFHPTRVGLRHLTTGEVKVLRPARGNCVRRSGVLAVSNERLLTVRNRKVKQLGGPAALSPCRPHLLAFEHRDRAQSYLASGSSLDKRLQRLQAVVTVSLERTERQEECLFDRALQWVLQPGCSPKERHRTPGHERNSQFLRSIVHPLGVRPIVSQMLVRIHWDWRATVCDR